MAKETERKFLVHGEFRHLAVRKKKVIQGYISVDPERIVRIRISDDKAYLSVKSSPGIPGITRDEWEYEIPLSEAEEMLRICRPGRIIKTRYYIPVGKHIFEVDEFHGDNEGLLIAEIELQNENEEFEKPAWLGEEVTGRPEFYNSNLI